MARFAENTLGRQLAMQFLFGVDYNEIPWEQAQAEFWRMDPLELNLQSFEEDEVPVVAAPRLRGRGLDAARRYADGIIAGVCGCGNDLDRHIIQALDNWKPERVGRIEMVIMRIALYEMLFRPETPGTVIISEAVQLANAFGDKEAPRFINGLLNRLLLQLRTETDENAEPETSS